MAAYPRVHTVSRWKQWQYTIRMWTPGVLTGLFGVSAALYMFCIAPNLEMTDVQRAIPRRGTGVVSSVTYIPVTKGNTDPSEVAVVSIKGDMIAFRTHAPLYKSERVRVIYRVGKSGRTYVDKIEQDSEVRP